jgi:N-acetylmuramoyl-L-alanine amidase
MTRVIKKIVVHCTDSQDSLDIGFREINEWHRQNGWISPSGISCGYHHIVRRDGTIEKGRPHSEVGSHVKGHNSDSIGVVWVGKKQPDEKQYEALINLVKTLQDMYKVPYDKVFGHCELFEGKTCPNIDMNFFRAELLFATGLERLS